MDITVVVPTLPSRIQLLERALRSVETQTLRAACVIVEPDPDRTGAAATRNRALSTVRTEWVAWLDDDDVFYPDHLRLLARHARLGGLDVAYPQYDCADPAADVDDGKGHGHFFGRPFDAGLLRSANYIPVTTLCRTAKVRRAGGFQPRPDVNGDPCEDWGLWLAMADQGCRFGHVPHTTWRWTNTDGTRGRTDR